MKYPDIKESVQYPSFYEVPHMPYLLINKDGVAISTDTNPARYIQVKHYKGSYPKILYMNDSWPVHRILAQLFLPIPDAPMEELDVNHKDGDKSNFSLDNLEWTTRSENCLHAYQTGLRNDNTPILVKDLRDDSITRYYSLQECARYFKTDASLIFHYLKPMNVGKICWNFYVIIREGDKWPVVNKADMGKHRNGTAKPMMATDLITKDSIIFESLGAAAEYYKFNAHALTYFLSKNKGKPYYGKIFKYIDDPSVLKDKEVVKLQKTWVRKKRIPIPVNVTHPVTKEVTRWDGVEAFGKSVGASKNTIQKRMLSTGGYWNKYKIEYITN